MPVYQIKSINSFFIYRSYFSDEGLEYSLCRIPIGGTDFSTHGYSYDDNNDEPDPTLSNFALAQEDYDLKVYESLPIKPTKQFP